MKFAPKITLPRILQYVFMALLVAGSVLLVLNQIQYFGLADGRPSITGWVSTSDIPIRSVSMTNPAVNGDLRLYNFNQQQFLVVHLAGRGEVFQSKYLGFILFKSLAWVCGLLVLYQMFRIFQNLHHGQTFREENIRRVRYIAFLIPAVPLAAFLAARILAGIVRALPDYQSVAVRPADSVEDIAGGLLIALLIFSLVEIFQRGTHLQQEQDLTI
ncbi:MAG: DUF2975 domain-containing protein [Thermoanaerobaculia bacterium]|nr:DUF2975 domain-containing protein [Thermoanaerobaculia bacterium]